MTETKLTAKTDSLPSPGAGELARLREWAVTFWKKCESWVRAPRFRIRPRLSLLTGSTLVLLTLYLPTAVGSCGSPEPGLKLASGSAGMNWPGLLGGGWLGIDSFPGIGRAFYLFCLALAALTLFFLLASGLRRDPVRKRRFPISLLAISGLTALLSTANFFLVAALIQTGPIIDHIFGDGTYIEQITFTLFLLLFPVACLRPEFRTKRGAVIWTAILAAISSATCYGDAFLSQIYPRLEGDDPFWTVTIIFAVSLLPLGLWFCYGLLGHAPSPLWPGVKRRLAIFYAGAVAVVLLTVGEFGYWGLISFFLGLYLTFFGYWQLRRAASEGPCAEWITRISAGTE